MNARARGGGSPALQGLLLVGVLAVLVLSGVPGPWTGHSGGEARLPATSGTASPPGGDASLPGGGQGAGPAPEWPLLARNLKQGETFSVTLLGPPSGVSWFLLSTDAGPTVDLFGHASALGADWTVLGGFEQAGADGRRTLQVPIPVASLLDDLGFRLQAVVFDPTRGDFGLSESIALRASPPGPAVQRVALIRQMALLDDAPFAPAAALDVQLHLQAMGASVTIFDDYLPPEEVLARFDVLLDLRFTLPPAESEKQQIAAFLRHQGGVFLVHGPFLLTPWAYLRHGWFRSLLEDELEIAVPFADGGNNAGAQAQFVDPASDPTFLYGMHSVPGFPLPVALEGANFGSVGAQGTGTPWVVDQAGPAPLVYGMLFEPYEMVAPSASRLAVLMTGTRASFETAPANPSATLIYQNLAFWLAN